VPDTTREPRPKLAFWIHQGIEYLVGFLVLSQALQASDPAVPVLAAVAVLALAATADGPLAAFKLVPRAVHRVLDVVVAVALAAVAVVARDSLGGFGLVVVAAVAVILGVLVYRTDYRVRARRPPPAEAPGPATGTGPGKVSSEDLGRAAGRAVGKGIRAYKRRGSV
jgi:hypothetical protein